MFPMGKEVKRMGMRLFGDYLKIAELVASNNSLQLSKYFHK